MDQLLESLTRLPSDVGEPVSGGPVEILAAVLMALFVGQAVAWIYQRTHSGLSYSMGFTQSLVLLTLGATLLMMVIGNSLVTAFGLLGALAIVRFRNVLKDTRDTVFVLFSLILGMAVGTERTGVALGGTFGLIAVVSWLHVTRFGVKGRFDGHVTYRVDNEALARARGHAEDVLRAFCRAVQRVTLHDTGRATEFVCAIHLRDPERASELARVLRTVPGIDDASIVMRDSLTEL